MTPQRIGYIGNFTRTWCTEVHVKAALESLGHDVYPMQENTTDFAALPGAAVLLRLDLVMWTRTWAVDNAAALAGIDGLRNMAVPIVSFHLDRFHGLEREYLIDTEAFFRTDMLFSPDDGPWAERGVAHHWMPPGVAAHECGIGRMNRRLYPQDVVFVGSHPYPHPGWEPYRTALLERFQRHFGKRFAVLPKRGQPIRGRALADLYATVPVILGDSCLVGNPTRYWSDRIPETLGRGGLLIHPAVDGLETMFKPADLLTYELGDFDQAVALADMALAHPVVGTAVRAHGQATVLGRDTYAHRMTELLEVVAARR